jgi:uncharacterized PurR-regulated membrane protein YhhQ (DUF165 family)
MAIVVVASNVLVQFPFAPLGLQDWLTWGAFTYPFAFLVTDLTNRWLGPKAARRAILVGFALAVLLSVALATPRIALASGLAFLLAQTLDVALFNRLRRASWWIAPVVSSVIGSALDTAVFFTLAFSCDHSVGQLLQPLGLNNGCAEGLPWQQWAMADFALKLAFAGALLVPYRHLTHPR